MEGSESVLNSYYPHHRNPNPTTTPNSSTNGLFSNPQNHNSHVSTTHYSSSEPTPLVFSPHSVTNRGLISTSSPSETIKRKRGRPRKYGTPELQPTSSPPPPPSLKKLSSKKEISSKKSQFVALGNAGQGFTPHIINVAAGEDVAQKIMLFMQQRKCAVCILSASGSISNASLRQPAMLGGNVTYEGRFEILSLSGSYLYSEIGGASSRTGGLSVCLSGADGRIVGGGVGGPLTAAGPVQVIIGSFLYDIAKDTSSEKKVDASHNKLPPQVAGASITSVTFQSAPDSSGRMLVRENDDHQNVGGNFMLQPRGMDVVSPHSTDWRGGMDRRSSANIEFIGRRDHGACQSPEDGDDEHHEY